MHLTKSFGERRLRLDERWAPADLRFERGHASEWIRLGGEHAPQPLGRGAEHHRAVLKKRHALAPLSAPDELVPVDDELVRARAREAERRYRLRTRGLDGHHLRGGAKPIEPRRERGADPPIC